MTIRIATHLWLQHRVPCCGSIVRWHRSVTPWGTQEVGSSLSLPCFSRDTKSSILYIVFAPRFLQFGSSQVGLGEGESPRRLATGIGGYSQ